jgi:hypothetical protein
MERWTMLKFIVAAGSGLAFLSAASVASAADLPRPQPAPVQPVVGKAPVGKVPFGKTPIGKEPVVTTRG